MPSLSIANYLINNISAHCTTVFNNFSNKKVYLTFAKENIIPLSTSVRYITTTIRDVLNKFYIDLVVRKH